MCLLKENREAAEEELKTRSAALVQNSEEVAQQRAESNALRFVLIRWQIKMWKMNNMTRKHWCDMHSQFTLTLLTFS